MNKTTPSTNVRDMSEEQFGALVYAAFMDTENIASGPHAAAETRTQASASAAWLRDGLESVAAALERIARALEQRPPASGATTE